MDKGTKNSGIPVFAEVIKLLDKQKINKIADIHKANRYTKLLVLCATFLGIRDFHLPHGPGGVTP